MIRITEIIPDDIPAWAKDAIDRGQLFSEIVSREEESRRRLELMWAWMAEDEFEINHVTGEMGTTGFGFLRDHPEADGWFDEKGKVK